MKLLCLAAAVSLTLAAALLDRDVRHATGVRFTFADTASSPAIVRLAETRRSIDLSYFDRHPDLPRRFFSTTWNAFWYLPTPLTVDLYAGGDDRVTMAVDGAPILMRSADAGMSTAMRTLRLDAGVHRLEVVHEQDGGGLALNVQWAPSGRAPRSMASATLFPSEPGASRERAVRWASRLKTLAIAAWLLPPLAWMLMRKRSAIRAWVMRAHAPRDSSARWWLLALVMLGVVLRVLLIRGTPAPFGYVYDPYYEPVELFYRTGRLPVAADCWQCYHPPLFYLVGLPFYAAGMWLSGHDGARALPVLSFMATACGAICAYYAYRLLRLFRMSGAPLVLASGIIAGIPFLFFSSYGAEADILLSAIMTAFLFHLTKYHTHFRHAGWRQAAAIGLLAGLAMATKYSGLVAIVVAGGTLAFHLFTGQISRAIRHGLVALAVCLVVGSSKYIENAQTKGTLLFANGSAQQGFDAAAGRRYWDRYDFHSFQLGELLALTREDAPSSGLTYLPIYRSVWTTLHGMAWGDMGFFTNPSRGGIDDVYVWRGVPSWLTSSVLVLGLLPNALAAVGIAATIRRRSLLPSLLIGITTFAVYIYWFTAQRDWALKTKYVLFLLPAYVVYATFGLRWLKRRVPPLYMAAFWLLAALVIVCHVYLFMFAVGA